MQAQACFHLTSQAITTKQIQDPSNPRAGIPVRSAAAGMLPQGHGANLPQATHLHLHQHAHAHLHPLLGCSQIFSSAAACTPPGDQSWPAEAGKLGEVQAGAAGGSTGKRNLVENIKLKSRQLN